jgi:hypothetical protein
LCGFFTFKNLNAVLLRLHFISREGDNQQTSEDDEEEMSKPNQIIRPSSQPPTTPDPQLSESTDSNLPLLVTPHNPIVEPISTDTAAAAAVVVEDTTAKEPKTTGGHNNSAPAAGNSAAPSGPRVKLTRKCPYVVGPHMSASILKGTPKPVITRKPPLLLKDKPKIPLKPNNLLLRSPSPHSLSSCSSSPSPTPSEPEQQQLLAQVKSAAEASAPQADREPAGTGSKRSASLVRGRNPVAAPRTFSFRLTNETTSLRKGIRITELFFIQ